MIAMFDRKRNLFGIHSSAAYVKISYASDMI